MRISLADYSYHAAIIQSPAVSRERPVADEARDKIRIPNTAETAETASSTTKPTLDLESISWARMSFDVDMSSRSLKVTLSDRNSGEVYRELVYDRSGLLHLPTRPESGRWIDRSV